MGVSTWVEGYKPPDEKWKKMKAIWDACQAAGVDVPRAVYDFFDGDAPKDFGVRVDLKKHECCSRLSENARDGFIIDVTKLPKDVTIIRFVNGW